MLGISYAYAWVGNTGPSMELQAWTMQKSQAWFKLKLHAWAMPKFMLGPYIVYRRFIYGPYVGNQEYPEHLC